MNPSMDMPDVPRHLRQPGDEGYRTPTIEDTEHFCQDGGHLFPAESVRDAHATALVAVADRKAQRTSSKSTEDDLAGRIKGVDGIGQSKKEKSEYHQDRKLSWKQRIRHMTWAYFTLTMATGGIANVLYNIPTQYRFNGLEAIGTTVFLINVFFYIMVWAGLIARFCFYPYTFKASFLHPTESLFVPATIVSFGTILINISQYGLGRVGNWLVEAVRVLFWFDATLAVIFSAGIYLLLWSTQTFTIAQMTPIWIFPAYPMLIIGPYAGVLSASLAPGESFSIIVGGATIQGVGFLVSMMVYSAFIYRLMTQKLPKENIRPGMFVSVGPSAFTVAGMINMASEASRSFPSTLWGDGQLAAMIVRVVANFSCLWLWGLAIFFFFIATFAHITAIGNGQLHFSMTWYSFVFPNTALITATFAIGKAFSSPPIEILGLVMTVLLIITYAFVFYMMIRAVILCQILWPQKGEDKDEGGFRIVEIKPTTSEHVLPM